MRTLFVVIVGLLTFLHTIDLTAQSNQEQNTLFIDFPWLSDLVDINNCTTEKVELYTSSIYAYLFVTSADGTATLYDQNGNFYCQNANNFDCPIAYNFGPPVASATWECGVSTPPNPCFCLLYTSPSPRDATLSRMPSSA